MDVHVTMTEPTPIASPAPVDTIETVYRRRHGDFLRVAAEITGSSDAALDAVQEALTRAFARRRSFRGEGSRRDAAPAAEPAEVKAGNPPRNGLGDTQQGPDEASRRAAGGDIGMTETMNFDPVVAAALERIAPQPAVEADEVLRRARAAALRQPASRRRLVAFAIVAALVLAGAAVAARAFGLFDWLSSNEPGSAHFVIDTRHRFRGRVPSSVECPSVKGRSFTCFARASEHSLQYIAGPVARIQKPRNTTRAAVLQVAAHAPAWLRRRLRREVRAVPPDFFRKYAVLATLQTWTTVFGLPGRSQTIYVQPPRDIPTWIVCDARERSGLQCHPLAGAGAVPLGAAIYEPSGYVDGHWALDWPRAKRPRSDFVPEQLAEHIWGRKLTPAELRLIGTLSAFGFEPGPRVR